MNKKNLVLRKVLVGLLMLPTMVWSQGMCPNLNFSYGTQPAFLHFTEHLTSILPLCKRKLLTRNIKKHRMLCKNKEDLLIKKTISRGQKTYFFCLRGRENILLNYKNV
jgi:hypothetical protein